jgi:hypothetical protein
VHLCYTGTILPLGGETLRAVLGAVRVLRDRSPELYDRLRLHFIGTSNQTTETDERRVMPVADELGVSSAVDEVPRRLPYSAIVRVQKRASALLAMGSTETHYTASKIFPMLLARRPLVAVYHERSTTTAILRDVGRPPTISVVTYTDEARAESRISALADVLGSVIQRPVWNDADVNMAAFGAFFAERLAGRLAGVLDRVVAPAA